MKQSLLIFIIAAVSLVTVVVLNEVNLKYLDGDFPVKMGMITNADEASYFQPADNFLANGEWKDKTTGNSSFIQRPPGYGSLYMLCKLISPESSFFVLKIVQLTLFFFGIILFAGTLKELGFKSIYLLTFTALYGLLPMFSGFVYYTLTEGITPFLMLLLVYSYLKVTSDRGSMSITLLIVSIILITTVRPQLLIFPLLILASLILKNRKFIVVSLAFVPFLIWQIRSYQVVDKWELHPIYSDTNHSIYRPPHKAMTNLFRLWEFKGDRFHESIDLLVSDSTKEHREKVLAKIPAKFHAEVAPILKEFQEISLEQREQFQSEIKQSLLDRENEFVRNVNKLTSHLVSENILLAYAQTPFMSGVELYSKSHLNLAVFQTHWRGNFIVELLRYVCLLLVLLFFSTTFLVVLKKWDSKLWIFAFGIFFTVLYLVLVQRLNEERYLTPMIPIAFIIAVHFLFRQKTEPQ